MQYLKQSTAVTIQLGPFRDKTDGVSPESTLAADMNTASTGVQISKNGAAFADRNTLTLPTYDDRGMYRVSLDTTDTGTLGLLDVIYEDASETIPVIQHYMVVPANTYDSLVSGSDYLQTDAVQVEGTDATDQIRDSVVDDETRIDGSAINTLAGHDPGSQIAAQTDVSGLNDPAASAIADAICNELLSGHTTAGSLAKAISDILADTGTTIPNTLGSPAGADLATDIAAVQTTADAIETNTQDIQGRIPDTLVSGRLKSDAQAISGSTDAADKLEASAETMITAAAAAGTLSTTQMTTTLTETTDDHYNGRVIIWTSGALTAQATAIDDYDGTDKLLTFTAVTEAPGDGDTFVIV